MEFVKSIALSVLLCLIITVIVSMLVPKSSMEKAIKYIISLFFLASIVYPFVENREDIMGSISSLNEYSFETSSETLSVEVNKTLEEITVEKIEQSIKNELLCDGVSVKEIVVEVNILEDNSIDISRAIVYVESESYYDSMRIKNVVKNMLGIYPTIEVSKEVN